MEGYTLALVNDATRHTFIDMLDNTVDDINPKYRSGIAYEHVSEYWLEQCMVYRWEAALLDLSTVSFWTISSFLNEVSVKNQKTKNILTKIMDVYAIHFLDPTRKIPFSGNIPSNRYRTNPLGSNVQSSKLFEYYKSMEDIYKLECDLFIECEMETAENLAIRSMSKLKFRSALNIYLLLWENSGQTEYDRRFDLSSYENKLKVKQHATRCINDLRTFGVFMEPRDIENKKTAESYVLLLQSMYSDKELNSAQIDLSKIALTRNLLGGITIGNHV